jgi:hypothetical protein
MKLFKARLRLFKVHGFGLPRFGYSHTSHEKDDGREKSRPFDILDTST